MFYFLIWLDVIFFYCFVWINSLIVIIIVMFLKSWSYYKSLIWLVCLMFLNWYKFYGLFCKMFIFDKYMYIYDFKCDVYIVS